MSKPKCEDIGFEHNWEDITPNIVYPTNQPSFPAKQRRCVNCGRHETLVTKQPLVQNWEQTNA